MGTRISNLLAAIVVIAPACSHPNFQSNSEKRPPLPTTESAANKVAADEHPGVSTESIAPVSNPPTPIVSETVCAERKYKIDGKCIDAVAVYKWFNTFTRHFLYTLTADQSCNNPTNERPVICKGEAVGGAGWTYQKIEFYVLPVEIKEISSLGKFFRLFKGDPVNLHFYTTDDNERQSFQADGFILELTHQIFVKQEPYTFPLYRWHNSETNAYLYSVSAGPDCQSQTLCNGEALGADWRFEKVAGYVFK